MHSKASALALAALVWPALMIAGINYSASKSNPGNIMISDGTNCTIIVVATNAAGSITGNSSTTSPCVVPNGEYYSGNGTDRGSDRSADRPASSSGGGWRELANYAGPHQQHGHHRLGHFDVLSGSGRRRRNDAGLESAFSGSELDAELECACRWNLAAPYSGHSRNADRGLGASDGHGRGTNLCRVHFGRLRTRYGPAAIAGNDILVPFNNANNNTTAIAMANPSANTEIVTFDSNANGAISRSTLALPGLGHAAFLLGNQLPMTAGISGSLEFTTSGSVSIIALQSNPGNFFTTAQTYRVNGPVIGASDPLKCLQNPLQANCSNPFLLLLPLTTNFMAGGTNYPILINITPGPNGNYNAAIGGSISGSPVNGYFTQGSVAFTNGQPSFTFNITGSGSTFTTGSLTFSLTETAYDAVTGVATAFLSGSLNLNQPGAGISPPLAALSTSAMRQWAQRPNDRASWRRASPDAEPTKISRRSPSRCCRAHRAA